MRYYHDVSQRFSWMPRESIGREPSDQTNGIGLWREPI